MVKTSLVTAIVSVNVRLVKGTCSYCRFSAISYTCIYMTSGPYKFIYTQYRTGQNFNGPMLTISGQYPLLWQEIFWISILWSPLYVKSAYLSKQEIVMSNLKVF